MKEFIFIWSVQNISYSWQKTGEKIISPAFVAVPLGNTRWSLAFYPRGENNSDFVSLYLERNEDDGPIEVEANVELSFISTENSLVNCKRLPFYNLDTIRRLGYSRLMCRHVLFGGQKALYLDEDILTFHCRMWKAAEGDVDEFGESFASTRLEIERFVLYERFNQVTAKLAVDLCSKSQNKTLLSINTQLREKKIEIDLIPIDVENIKYSTCQISLMAAKISLYERWGDWLGPPTPEVWEMPLPVNEKIMNLENEAATENPFEFKIKFVYSTGEETYKIEESYSQKYSKFLSNFLINVDRDKWKSKLSQRLWVLYSEQILCDVEFKTETKSFWVHSAVLAARSPVFLAMLTTDMREKRSKCVEVKNLQECAAELLLRYIYTDTFCGCDWETMVQLYCAADFYQIEALKSLCVSDLLDDVDCENVCELLLLADMHNDSHFEKELHQFILRDDTKIFASSTWKEFASERSSLHSKTMSKYESGKGSETIGTASDDLPKDPGYYECFNSLYEGGIATDISIKTTDSTFHAHKAVLCANSFRIRALLTSNSEDILKMVDLEEDVVSLLLRFMYTGALEDIEWATAKKLYKAAHSYQVDGLRFEISIFLLENLESFDASDLLLLAHEHHDAVLKSSVEDFIFQHEQEIFGSDQWDTFSRTNLQLAYETMHSKYKREHDFPYL